MRRLSASVFLFDPEDPPTIISSSSSSTNANGPRLILILSWFAAHEIHIAKYVAQHRVLFPSSRILLVRCPLNHVFFPFGVTSQLRPAVEILRSLLDEGNYDGNHGQCPAVLVHMFSNGGMNSMTRLLAMLRGDSNDDSDTAPPEAPFPRHVMVCDSCPGYFHWQRFHRAISQALPAWTSPLVHLGIAISWLLSAPLGREPPPNVQARGLNAKPLAAVQARRLYLYGTGDDMVHWGDVEDHAARAAAAGVEVAREVFEGGKHVAHVRVDAERYWRAVKEVWEGDK